MIGGTAMAQTMDAKSSSQTEVSDKEVGQFVEAYQNAQSVQKKMKSKMMTSIKDKGLTMQEFMSMRRTSMNPKKEMTASAEKQKKFKKVQADMKKMQPKMQKKVESAIEKSGLTMKRYQTIGAAVQKDKELQQKIQNKMMKSSGAMQKGGGGM
jgi:hypothetical protein